MKRRDKLFSVEHEPALQAGHFTPDPAEARAGAPGDSRSELERLRDSVAAEPALAECVAGEAWSAWLDSRRAACTPAGNLLVTLLAAVLGGPAAVLGVFLSGHQGAAGLLYVVAIAPVLEELLKQSGMLYILERMPYRISGAWQFLLAAAVSGLTFSAIENVVYVSIHAAHLPAEKQAALAAYRWAVCTPLHVGCALLGSLGLVRVWKKRYRDGRPADLSVGMPPLVAAMAIHGTYNLLATFVGALVEF